MQIPRDTGDFRILTRRVIEELRSLNETHGFLRGLVAYVGFKQTFVEYERHERAHGAGNYNRFVGSLKIGLNGIISFSSRPLQLMSFAGAVVAGFSFLLGLWYVIQKLIGFELTPGLPTTVLVVTFFAGVQLLSLGLIGEYVGTDLRRGEAAADVHHRPPGELLAVAYFVTGCAGFIGSNLVDRLLRDGHAVIGYDNLSTGQPDSWTRPLRSPRFTLVQGDMLDLDALTRAMRGAEFVFHLAANADVRFGTEHPRQDLEQNTLATFNVLEAMRAHGVRRIAFSSTGSIYGEPDVFPTPEDAPLPGPDIALRRLQARRRRADRGLLRGLRLPGLHLPLRVDPGRALHPRPRVRLLPAAARRSDAACRSSATASSASPTSTSRTASTRCSSRSTSAHATRSTSSISAPTSTARWTTPSAGSRQHLGLSPERAYTGGERGWIGDSPFIFLDCSRIRALGWKPALTIREGIIRTLRYLEQHPWLLDRRA